MHQFKYHITVVNLFADVYMQVWGFFFGKTEDALEEGPPRSSCALWNDSAFPCEGLFRFSFFQGESQITWGEN